MASNEKPDAAVVGPDDFGQARMWKRPASPLSRRRFLVASTSVIGLTGATVASWPFIASWLPSKKAQALGASIHLNVGKMAPGMRVTISWQGKPVWVIRRTPEMLENLKSERLLSRLADPHSEVETQQPGYAHNDVRAVREEFFVVIAICTHLGCIPLWRPDFPEQTIDKTWFGGFFCPCHKSKFDLAGRVYKYVPAPTNLVVPPHRYLTANVLEIGLLGSAEKA